MSVEARAFCERYFERLYTERNASVIDEMRAPSAGANGLASDGQYRALIERVHATFDDITMKVERVVQSGDEAMLALRFRASTLDGKRVEMRGSSYVRFEGGKIFDSDNVWDIAGLFASLGSPLDDISTVRDAVEHVAQRHGAR